MPRLIAIGDIHGCSAAFQTLIDEISPQSDDTIVTLGDYVDRGPDSRGVLELLMDLSDKCQLVPLRGNHEIMMLQAFDDYSQAAMWMTVGGTETIDSYGGGPENVPLEHFEFLRRTVPFHETAEFLFVHANYVPDLPLAKQPADVLYWEHLDPTRLPRPHVSGRTAVVGHTPQKNHNILDEGYLICLDTGCYAGGWLTALDLRSRTCWQADKDGNLRLGE